MAAIVPFLDRTKKTEDTGTPDEACPIGEPPGGPLPTLEGLLGCGDCGAPQDPSLGDAGDLVEGLGPPKFEGLGAAKGPRYGIDYLKPETWPTHYDLARDRTDFTTLVHQYAQQDLGVDEWRDVPKKHPIIRAPVADLYREAVEWGWDERGPEHVDALVESMQEGVLLPPVVIGHLGAPTKGLVDGRHRVLAAHKLGLEIVPAIDFDGPAWTSARVPGHDQFAMGDFGVVRDVPELESSHAELTRTAWIRRGLEEELLTGGKGGGPRDFWVESDCKSGELYFHLDPAMQKDILPWYVGVGDVTRFALFGSNGKMRAPTFDLPAGAPSIGGSCPGATAGQTVVEPEKRKGQLDREGNLPPVPGLNVIQSVDERRAICQNCYALEGNYPSPHVQIGEILRYWWSRSMLAEGRGEEWVETMVRAVGALNIPRTRQGIRPIRVHSAGDFFSPQYAEAWMEVANRVWDLEVTYGRTTPEIRFWAPTRTWAAKGFDWDKIANRLAQPNMIVRPSSYHVDDPAPGMLTEGWPMGATSIINDHNRGMIPELAQVVTGEAGEIERLRAEQRAHAGLGPDDRYDWQCMTYAIALKGSADLAPSCEDAIAPDGKRGCRACWTHPQLRVNYTTH